MQYNRWQPEAQKAYTQDLEKIKELYAPQIAMDMNDATERGMLIGMQKGMQKVARALLNDECPIKMIAKYTGLSETEILNLRKK
jgi:hypothetical protein